MITYLDCFSGISGDMLLGALIDAGLSLDDLRTDLSRLPLTGYEVTAERVAKQGIVGTQVQVSTEESHVRRGLADVLDIIASASLPPDVGQATESAFRRLAEAEAHVHGTSVTEVHFHEVGAVDAIVDIVGAFCGLRRLGVTEVYASALPLGGGWVDSAHGRLPVPAPATVELLKGVPAYGGPVEAELVTPTGAAILTSLCRQFGTMPPMTLHRIGWGAGRLDLPHPNLLRLFLGEGATLPREQRLVVIETNLDNMNPELFGYLMDRLFAAGALDVFYSPVTMKKSRPATVISVLSEPALADSLSEIIFRETTTLGIRLVEVRRRCLDREWRVVETDYGRIRVKIGRLGSEILSAAPEYDDCRKVAQSHGVPAKTVYDAAKAAFSGAGGELPLADGPGSEP